MATNYVQDQRVQTWFETSLSKGAVVGHFLQEKAWPIVAANHEKLAELSV